MDPHACAQIERCLVDDVANLTAAGYPYSWLKALLDDGWKRGALDHAAMQFPV